jgi:hypothetical protein
MNRYELKLKDMTDLISHYKIIIISCMENIFTLHNMLIFYSYDELQDDIERDINDYKISFSTNVRQYDEERNKAIDYYIKNEQYFSEKIANPSVIPSSKSLIKSFSYNLFRK